MPHQCVRCTKFYDDGSNEILAGCPCGGRLFFYIKKKHIEDAKNLITNLNPDEKQQIEKDVFDLVDIKTEEDRPVILDFESIHVLKPGKYELDLIHLFKKDPLIFKVGTGKYIIDINETFKQSREKK